MLKQVTGTPLWNTLNPLEGKIKTKTSPTFQKMRNRNKDFWSENLNKKLIRLRE